MDERKTGGDSGQVESISVILVLGLSIISIAIISGFSVPAVSDGMTSIKSERMDGEMSILESRIAAVSSNLSVGDTAEFNAGGEKIVSESGSVRINVTQEYTGGTWKNRSIYDGQAGRIEYSVDGVLVAYEAGTVLKRDVGSNNSAMVSEPEISYDGNTVTVSVYNITTNTTVTGETVSVSLGGGERSKFPNESYTEPGEEAMDNPVGNGTVYFTVETDYYRAWERYFRDEPHTEVESVDPGEGRVKAELLDTEQPDKIESSGVSEHNYDVKDGPFGGDIEEGTVYPTVDEWISELIEYGRENPDVENVSECNGLGCSPSSSTVYYADGDYTVDADVNTDNGVVFLVVDGVATIDGIEATGTESNEVSVVSTDGFVFEDGYSIGDSSSTAPDRVVLYTVSDSLVRFDGSGTGQGVVYAPDSTIDVGGMDGGTWNGSFVGGRIISSGSEDTGEVSLSTDVDIDGAESDTSLHITEKKVEVR